jgi:hypothetical protein
LRVRRDPPLNVSTLTSVMSDPTDVQVADGGLDIVMKNDNPGSTAAWINLELSIPATINFFEINVSFTSAPAAQGLLTIYIDGQEFGRVDERHPDDVGALYEFNTPGDIAPGSHILSFRLDKFSPATSNVLIENIVKGVGKFGRPGDINEDGVVGVPDLLSVINAWGPCGPPTACLSDIAPAENGDGVVGVPDLLMVINNWGQ